MFYDAIPKARALTEACGLPLKCDRKPEPAVGTAEKSQRVMESLCVPGSGNCFSYVFCTTCSQGLHDLFQRCLSQVVQAALDAAQALDQALVNAQTFQLYDGHHVVLFTIHSRTLIPCAAAVSSSSLCRRPHLYRLAGGIKVRLNHMVFYFWRSKDHLPTSPFQRIRDLSCNQKTWLSITAFRSG